MLHPPAGTLAPDRSTPALPEARVPELDGVRALAIWAVLVVHLTFPPVGPVLERWLPRPLWTISQHGWLGVDLFFVLSGFLITGILLDTKTRPTGSFFGEFYRRRALRILPVYAIVLATLWLIAGSHFAPYFTLCLVFAANLAGLLGISGFGPAGPLWSLAVEEQFYLVWPWIVRAFGRREIACAGLAVLIGVPIVRAFLAPDAYVLTWARADGLAMGALLALWIRSARANPQNSRRLIVGLLGAAAALTIVEGASLLLRRGDALSGSLRISEAVLCFGALVLFAFVGRSSQSTAFLRHPFALWTAQLSYAIYLVHVPLRTAYTVMTERWLPELAASRGVPFALLQIAVVVGASYGIAALSRRYVELPFLRLGRKASASPERAGGVRRNPRISPSA